MSDISLRLLEPEDADVAGRIVGIAHDAYQTLGPFEGQWWLNDFFIPALRKGIEEGELVVGGENSSGLVTVYELPRFLRTGQIIENPPDSFGWLATSEQNKGIGTAFMQKLANVFAQTAFQAGVQKFIHYEQVTNSMNRAFFERRGYKVVGTSEGDRSTFYHCVKEYASSPQTLSPLEQRIADQIITRASLQQTI